MKFVDKNGYLTVPLYHGTSSIFKDSIIKNGLGAPVYGHSYNIELFKKICLGHNNSQWQSIWWRNNSYIWESMLDQKINKSVNFRYGGTYLSPSKENAEGYAKYNRYGSELLSSIIEALQELEKFDTELASGLVPHNHWIRNVMTQTHRPILITIQKINLRDLSTEKDQSTIELLKHMEKVSKQFPEISTDIIWSQLNFHCSKTIPITAENIEHIH